MMSLLARLPVADCEVVHTLLLRYEASHQRQVCSASRKVRYKLIWARTYGVSQATVSRLASEATHAIHAHRSDRGGGNVARLSR